MHRLQHCCVTLVSSKFLPPQSFPPHSTPSSRFAPPQTNAPYPSCTPSLNTSQFPHNLYPAGVPFPPDSNREIWSSSDNKEGTTFVSCTHVHLTITKHRRCLQIASLSLKNGFIFLP